KGGRSPGHRCGRKYLDRFRRSHWHTQRRTLSAESGEGGEGSTGSLHSSLLSRHDVRALHPTGGEAEPDHPRYPREKTFFLNSGAEAVENAVKIARKFTGRRAILSFERGFHGRTLLAMSLTSKVKPYKHGFGPFAPDTYKLPYPYYYRAPGGMSPEEVDRWVLGQIEDIFLKEVPPEDVAAVIIEPVQGEGGFVVPSAFFIRELKALCEKHGILFIADEVQTGFGRTGKMFAMEHFGVVPDIITMSKSIGAGIPISAVTGRAEIMDAPAQARSAAPTVEVPAAAWQH